MIACITINLKQKLAKNSELNIHEFIEQRINNENYEKLLNYLLEKEYQTIIFEENSLININNYEELIDFLIKRNIKIIILYTKMSVLEKYFNINFFNLVNILDNDYVSQIIHLYSNDFTINNALEKKLSHSLRESEFNNYNNNKEIPTLSSINLKKENIYQKRILGINLDAKCFASTFLLNLINTFDNNIQKEFIQVHPSNLDYTQLVEFKNYNITFNINNNFKKIYSEIKINNSLKKSNYIQVIDYGQFFVEDLEWFTSLDLSVFDKIILFSSNSKFLLIQNEYKKILDYFNSQKNVTILNKSDIFNKILSLENQIILDNNNRNKFIKKCLSIKENHVWNFRNKS